MGMIFNFTTRTVQGFPAPSVLTVAAWSDNSSGRARDRALAGRLPRASGTRRKVPTGIPPEIVGRGGIWKDEALAFFSKNGHKVTRRDQPGHRK